MLITKWTDELEHGSLRLSNRQMKYLRDVDEAGTIPLSVAVNKDRRTFSSLLTPPSTITYVKRADGTKRRAAGGRGYLEIISELRNGKREEFVHLTELGKRALNTWDRTSVDLKHESKQFPKSLQEKYKPLARFGWVSRGDRRKTTSRNRRGAKVLSMAKSA